MKKIIVIAVMLILLSSADELLAQRRGFDLDKRMENMKKELNLTAEQESILKGIFKDFQSEISKLMNESDADREEKREKMRELREELNKDIKEHLSPEQIKKFENLEKKERNFKRNSQNRKRF